MARPRKQTVDYFPHYCMGGKTMFILEQKYGNDGYAFWFKLLEMLGASEGHYLQLENPADLEFLTAKTHIEADKCEEILSLLAKLDAIDADLWNEHKVVWSDNFASNISDAYRNRKVDTPSKPDFSRQKPTTSEVSSEEKREKSTDEMKLDETKEDIMSSPLPQPKEIVDLYNRSCPSLPKVKIVTEKRKKAIRARWKQYPELRVFEKVFCKAEASDFLSGRNEKWTSCNFDWLMNENNMIKVLEGNYDRNARASPLTQQTSRPEDFR